MKNLRSWVLLISVICLMAVPSRAQTSTISGTVKVQHRPAGVSAFLLNAEGNYAGGTATEY
jgi:hypothetical protein